MSLDEVIRKGAKRQGKIIIENDGDGYLLIMFPNGDVRGAKGKRQANAIIKEWLREDLRESGEKAGIANIEWRGC